jgi:hypothetical protein
MKSKEVQRWHTVKSIRRSTRTRPPAFGEAVEFRAGFECRSSTVRPPEVTKKPQEFWCIGRCQREEASQDKQPGGMLAELDRLGHEAACEAHVRGTGERCIGRDHQGNRCDETGSVNGTQNFSDTSNAADKDDLMACWPPIGPAYSFPPIGQPPPCVRQVHSILAQHDAPNRPAADAFNAGEELGPSR